MIGVDLVHIPTFTHTVKDAAVLQKLFSKDEQQHSPLTLAGFFAAKEAFIKASGLKPEWTSIIIKKNKRRKT